MQPSFDKQFVRNWLLSPESGWDRGGDEPPPPLPPTIVDATRERYINAYERISGLQFADWIGRRGVTGLRHPPVAKRVEHRREHHGDVFVDPYEWLRDKSDPAVIEYLDAENAYTEQVTGHLAPLRQKIFDEIKARTKETICRCRRRDEWWYYTRSFEGKQYSVHCRCPITGPDDWTPPSSTMTPRSRRTGAAHEASRRRATTSSRSDPKIVAFAEHYQTVILPAKPFTPRHKGKIEAGIKYVQNNALKGRRFPSLAQENEFLLDWESRIARHPHSRHHAPAGRPRF